MVVLPTPGRGCLHRLPLLAREPDAGALFEPGDRPLHVSRPRLGGRAAQAGERRRRLALAPPHRREREAGLALGQDLAHHHPIADQPLGRLVEQRRRHRQELGGPAEDRVLRRVHVAVLDQLAHDVEQSGLHPLGRGRLHPQVAGDAVGDLETDAPDVDRKAIRIPAHHRDRVLAVAPVDAHRVRARDPVPAQEHHDVLDLALPDPGVGDAARARRPDPVHFGQALGRAADHVQRVDPEALDQALGQLGADTRDHAGSEIALDPEQRLRRPGVVRVHPELSPELPIGLPRAAQNHRRADRDPEQRADHGHQRTAAGRLEPRDRPLVVRILEDDPLESAFQDSDLALPLRRHMVKPPSTSIVRPLK
jgi:hypothetical protein